MIQIGNITFGFEMVMQNGTCQMKVILINVYIISIPVHQLKELQCRVIFVKMT